MSNLRSIPSNRLDARELRGEAGGRVASSGGPAGPIRAVMNPRRALVLALTALAGLAVACSHTPPPQAVLDPPRVDLSRFGTLGLVEFESGAVDGFGAEVSREYLSALQAAQPGTPVLELG